MRLDGANEESGLSRRDLLRMLGAAGLGAAGLAAGCGGAAGATSAATAVEWTAAERALLAGAAVELPIPAAGTEGTDVLRRRAREVAPGAELGALEGLMRASLQTSGGVGLAAPQVGIGLRAVLVQLDARSESPRTVWCLNPRILERSDALQDDLEGCLSIPDFCGLVRRHLSLRVAYLDGAGEETVLEVRGFDARIFQHEIDHLDGVLYTDRLLGPAASKERLRPLRTELAARRERGEAGDLLTIEQVADLMAWTE